MWRDDATVQGLAGAWNELDGPWQAAFQLAWEGLWAGSPPVGAVVSDRRGQIVCAGRSRRLEQSAPSGQLAGTNLAHAEVNALVQLPPGDYSDHVLTATLEPCLLCTAAATHSHIGTVRYAAADPLWVGLRDLPTLNPHVARRWPQWEGPLAGPFASLSRAFVALWHLRHRPSHPLLDIHRRDDPEILEVAARLGATLDGREERLDRALGDLDPILDIDP